ncbi:MAG: hypothetical protein KGL39_15970 [Patescibacteria group bacterium]|nr:hypothetical protein [Patescibacteria group bacterium]
MAKYRKKPVEVEAWEASMLLVRAATRWSHLPQCIRDAYKEGNVGFMSDHIRIRTLEGVMRAGLADMVICGVEGELYSCKADVFARTYEFVEAENGERKS